MDLIICPIRINILKLKIQQLMILLSEIQKETVREIVVEEPIENKVIPKSEQEIFEEWKSMSCSKYGCAGCQP